MQTPRHAIGPIVFKALPAVLAGSSIPNELASWAEWCVVAFRAETEGHYAPSVIVGWLAPNMPVPAGRRKSRGRITCFTGGGNPYGPDLKYLRQASSSRQATRLIAEATKRAAASALLPRGHRL